MLADTWSYAAGDGCINFFSTCLTSAQPPIEPVGRVLEIGCAEADWIGPATAAWPAMQFTGIDWRNAPRKNATFIQGDVCTHAFPDASFDLIVSVSAIEHIGLCHYKNTQGECDPRYSGGDVVTLNKCWDWLNPGGWLFFDVPWNAGADAYVVHGTSHRVYDDAAVELRLRQWKPWVQFWTGVARPGHEDLLLTNPPRRQVGNGEQFYYKGFWWQKPL